MSRGRFGLSMKRIEPYLRAELKLRDEQIIVGIEANGDVASVLVHNSTHCICERCVSHRECAEMSKEAERVRDGGCCDDPHSVPYCTHDWCKRSAPRRMSEAPDAEDWLNDAIAAAFERQGLKDWKPDAAAFEGQGGPAPSCTCDWRKAARSIRPHMPPNEEVSTAGAVREKSPAIPAPPPVRRLPRGA